MRIAGEHQIVAGFMPLLDSAILVAAREKGFTAAEAIDLVLVRETSWANIRDRMAVGHFQVAHVLAPMPIASNLGLTPLAVPVIAPMALGLGGNAVTVLPTQMEVTTQQAANLLNVSRPHVVKLLEEKKIPSRRVGNRRRIRLSDLIAFKRRDEGARQKIVDELANEAQELGIY